MRDIYFENDMGSCMRKSKAENVNNMNTRMILAQFVICSLNEKYSKKSTQQVYYDLVTPYGYGGPLIVECIEGKQKSWFTVS